VAWLTEALVFAALAVAPAARAGEDVWTPLGLNGGVVFSLAAAPEPGGIVYAGTAFGGVYRSLDDGASWTPLLNQISQPTVLALALDPDQPTTVWAGTSDVGVWKSSDAGDHWTQASQGLGSQVVRALAYHPTADVLIAATSDAGIFRSLDGGASWSPANSGLTTQNVSGLALAGVGPVVYASSSADGVFRSDDLGLSWRSVGAALPDRFVTSVAARSDDPDRVFAGTLFDGLQVSSDGGQTWAPAGDGIGSSEIRHVALHRDAPSVVWVATRTGLFRSADGGESFVATSIDELTVSQVALRAGSAGRSFAGVFFGGILINQEGDALQFTASNRGLLNVFAGNIRFQPYLNAISVATNQGIHVSFDGGGGFFQTAEWDGPPSVFSFELDPDAVGRWYAGIEEDGLVRTDFFGFEWQRKNQGLVPQGVTALVPDPFDPTRVFATSAYRGIFTSTDGGRRWEGRDLRNMVLFDLAADPSAEGHLFAASNAGLFWTSNRGEGWLPVHSNLGPGPTRAVAVVGGAVPAVLAVRSTGLFRSTNGGFSWNPVDLSGPSVLCLAVDPSSPGRVYAGTAGGFVYRSDDAGATFAPTGASAGDAFVFSLVVTASGQVLAGTLDGVRRSLNGGASWSAVVTGTGRVLDLATDPADPAHVMGAAGDAGLLESTDGGASFSLRALGAGVLSVAASPGEPGTVLLGTERAGVLATSDGGLTRTPRFEGMSVFVDAIAVDPSATQTLFAGTIFNGVYRSRDHAESWEPVGLEGRVVPSLLVPRIPGNPILAGTDDGVFASQDGGDSWFKYGLDRLHLLALENPPAAPGTLYVSGAPNELFRSSDSGVTFSRVGSGLPSANVTALEGDPFDAGTLFAGTEQGLFRSRDAGVSFAPVGSNLGNHTILSLRADPTTPGRLFAGTNGAGLFRSASGGDGFIPLELTPNTIRLDRTGASAIVTHPAEPGAVYTGLVGGEIHLTVDGGETFSDLSPDSGPFNPLDLAGDPFDGNRLFAATNLGVKRSSDRGATWSDAVGLPGLPMPVVRADPSIPGIVYAGSVGGGLYRSSDFGASFAPLPVSALDSGLTNLNLLSLLVHPADPGTRYLGASFGEVYLSSDGGQHFERRDLGTPNVLALAGDPLDPLRLYAGTEDGLYRSLDGGASWEDASQGLTERRVFSIAVDPADALRLIAGTNGGGVFASTDGGDSWSPLGSGLGNPVVFSVAFDGSGQLHAGTGSGAYRFDAIGALWLPPVAGPGETLVTSLSADPADPNGLYIAVPGAGVLRSGDGGASFGPANGDLSDLQVVSVHAAAGGSRLFVGTAPGDVYRSDDGGIHWTALDPGNQGSLPRAIATVPGDSQTVWLATLGAGAFASADAGESWSPLGAAVAETIFDLAFDPSGRLYAATDQGAFRSDDRGRTWLSIQQGLPPGPVTSLAENPAGSATLFAVAGDGALFATADGGASWSAAGGGDLPALASVHQGAMSGLVFAGDEDGGVFRSADGGASWQAVVIRGTRGAPRFAVVPQFPTLVYVASETGMQVSFDGGLTFYSRLGAVADIVFAVEMDGSGRIHAATDAGLFTSSDAGDTWSGPPVSLPANAAVVSLAAERDSPGTLLAATTAGELFRSADGGTSFAPVTIGLGEAEIVLLHESAWPSVFYAAARDGTVFASLDGGQGWYPIGSGAEGRTIRAIGSDPGSPLEVQLATDAGLLLSHDAGGSWASALSSLMLEIVHGLTPLASVPGRIYAATSDGVYRSDDAGRSFVRRSQGLVYTDPVGGLSTSFTFEVALNPYVPDRLFAATPGGGVFRSDDGGLSWAPMNQGLSFRRVIGISVDPLDPNHVVAGCEGGGLHEITLPP
jgi:photosystem II stability/assembly factor-like uncharacterized protein